MNKTLRLRSAPLSAGMRIHEDHEADSAYGGINLFCSENCNTKQILTRAFWRFCLIHPHIPHTLRIANMVEVSVTGKNTQNMRIMRIHEEGLFKKIIMPYIKRGPGRDPKHEADMRIHEADDAEKPFFFPLEDAMKDDLVRIMLWVVVIVSISAMVWVVFGE